MKIKETDFKRLGFELVSWDDTEWWSWEGDFSISSMQDDDGTWGAHIFECFHWETRKIETLEIMMKAIKLAENESKTIN